MLRGGLARFEPSQLAHDLAHVHLPQSSSHWTPALVVDKTQWDLGTIKSKESQLRAGQHVEARPGIPGTVPTRFGFVVCHALPRRSPGSGGCALPHKCNDSPGALYAGSYSSNASRRRCISRLPSGRRAIKVASC